MLRLTHVPLHTAWLVAACVATNPDWDPPSADDAGESSGMDEHSSESGSDAGTNPSDGQTSAAAETCLQAGLALCEDATTAVCVDLLTDDHHCGACFRACTTIEGSACVNGQCRCGNADWGVCGGACRKVRDDPRACGPACVDCVVEAELAGRSGEDVECKGGVCEED